MHTRQVERPAQDRQGGQDHQRDGDDLRAFLGVRGSRVPGLAEEDHPDLAAHVEGGQEGGDGQQPVDGRKFVEASARISSFDQKPASGKIPASASAPIRYTQKVTGICLRRPPMLRISLGSKTSSSVDRARMLVVVSKMVMAAFQAEDDRTGGEEQQRLEESMRDQVEHASHKSAHPDRRHHETELGDGRISQHLLDIVLPDGNRGGEQGRDAAHQRNRGLRLRHQRVERRGAGHQVDAGRHHGGGMDQGRDRGGAGHGIRQPDVQRELRRFPRHAHQQEQGDEEDHAGRGRGDLRCLGKDTCEMKGL